MPLIKTASLDGPTHALTASGVEGWAGTVDVRALPDPEGVVVPAAGSAGGHDKWAQIWAWITDYTAAVPGWMWAACLTTLFAFTLIALPMARRQTYKAGRRTSGKTKLSDSDRKDRRMLAAVLTPAILFWIAVLVGSGRGLIAFAETDLKWDHGWEFLVPLTLDGVAVAFGALAFRAISKERSPDRAYRVVWIATGASALINFLHEVNGSALGAGYLAVLSLFGMLIFHELLAQFEEGAAWIKRDNPKFGLRWFTWPTNTVCAWFAWHNHPVDSDGNATIAGAVRHLEAVRLDKKAKAAAEVDKPAWWMRLAPASRIKQLGAALEAERATSATGREDDLREIDRLLAEIASRASAHESEVASMRTSVASLEAGMEDLRAASEKRVKEAEDGKAEALAEQARRYAEADDAKDRRHAAEVDRIRAEAATANIADYRNRPSGGTSKAASGRGSKTPPKPRLSDEDAVQQLLSLPADPAKQLPPGIDREWSQSAIVDKLEVGWGRAPRLAKAVAEEQHRRRSEGSSDDDKERAS